MVIQRRLTCDYYFFVSRYLATFEPNVHLSQEQMVAKLNVTYLSLLRLGFEKDDIEVALRHTYTGESEDALDWVAWN